VQTLLSEFSISDVEGDVTEQMLTQKGKVYFVCVTRFDRVSRRCAERLHKVIDFAEQEGSLVICLTPQPLRYATWHSFDDSKQIRCYNIDATVMKTMLRAENGLVVLNDGVIEAKYNCRSIDFIE
jgi:triosephosphate isomerase